MCSGISSDSVSEGVTPALPRFIDQKVFRRSVRREWPPVATDSGVRCSLQQSNGVGSRVISGMELGRVAISIAFRKLQVEFNTYQY